MSLLGGVQVDGALVEGSTVKGVCFECEETDRGREIEEAESEKEACLFGSELKNMF